ncbi:WD40 repeat domain-containing protein [Nonomuraea sp. NPDC050328]|uniref:WD40 repeat domain-containing protein n=1 Tax=Nonomuraea sp. NPDC050328 TaxID=3364361 RepID=UPI0037879B2D
MNDKPVIVTGGSDGLLRIWDFATHKLIGEPIRTGQGRVNHVELHHWDGKDIAVVSGGTLRAWDLGARRPLTPPMTTKTLDTNLLAVGMLDGARVALTEGEYSDIQLWNLASGQAVGAPLEGQGAEPWDGAIGNVGGRTVAITGDDDGGLHSWDLGTGKALASGKVASIEYISSIGIQDGVAVITGSDGDFNGRMERWDLTTGVVTEVQHEGKFAPIELRELGGRTVTILGGNSTLRVTDLATGEIIGHGWDSDDLLDHVMAVGMNGTTPILVISDDDATVTVWNLHTGKQLGKPIFGGGGSVASLAVARVQGKTIVVTAGHDDTINMWDLATHKPFRTPISCACVEDAPVATATRNGKSVIVYADIDGLTVRDTATGKRVAISETIALPPGGGAQLATERSLVAAPIEGDQTMLWDLSGDGFPRPINGASGAKTVAIGSPPGGQVIATATGKHVRLWNAASGQPIGNPITIDGEAESLAIGHVDGRTIIFSRRRYAPDWGSIRLWDATTGMLYGKALRIRSTAMIVTRVGSRTVLATGHDDGTVIVWDPRTMEPLLPPFSGHHGAVTGLAITMLKGKPIAVSGGSDGSVRVWDLTDLSH